MAATNPLAQWQDTLQHLQLLRTRLADRADGCLAGLVSAGTPLEPGFIDDLSAYGLQLTLLFEDVSNGGLQVDRSESVTLEALSKGIEQFAQCLQARQVLMRVLHLSHVADPHFEPLLSLQDQARTLLYELSKSPPNDSCLNDLKSLTEGDHPFCHLLRWQRADPAMQDQEWDRLHDHVADAFGRSLATAVSRGRIVFPPALDSDAKELVAPESIKTVDFVPEVSFPTNRIAVLGQPEPSFVYDFASTGTKMTGVLDSVLERAFPAPIASSTGAPLLRDEMHVPVEEGTSSGTEEVRPDSGMLEAWSKWRERRGLRREDAAPHQTPAAALAEAALVATGEERARCLFRLIDQLLIDDRLDLACQFMRVLEGQPVARLTPLPASLIRACLLGRHVCYPQGELNRHIEDDLRKQQPKRYQDLPAEGRLAYEFLCRAAALLPALLCSSTSAVRLLQAFPIEPGLIQLYNYGSRIASYAERLQGRTGEMLQTGDIGTGGSSELAALRHAAHDWFTQSLKQTVTYSRSSPLFLHAHWSVSVGTVQQSPEIAHAWSQWQETWLTVYRLLRPVIRGLGSDRTWVKHEIERLSPLLRAGTARPGQANSSEATDAQCAMRAILSQAVEFAAGWLRLEHGSSSSTSHLPVREMEELSAEVRERSAAVLAELRPFAGVQRSPTVRAAAFCLMRVIQRIRALFEAETSLTWREPDLRHLLNAELLKIPCLPLNDQWEPIVDADVVEAELLEQISRGAGSWREAFDQQCRHGDHVATGRLLELAVWSAGEQAELSKIRQELIAESRADLLSDLEVLRAEMESLLAKEALAAADQAILRRRIERLESSVSKTFDFPIADIQVQQLRLLLHRRSAAPRSAEDESTTVRRESPLVGKSEMRESMPSSAVQSQDASPEDSGPENAWVMDLLWEDH